VIRLLTDEDFDGRLLRVFRRRFPEVDVVRVQDEGLMNTPDSEILAWCARRGRVLLTHDRSTMTRYAYDRVRAGQPMPGVLVVRKDAASLGDLADVLGKLARSNDPEHVDKLVLFVPQP
jgi:predicted nuclease of predicted toxin-antitoxin system